MKVVSVSGELAILERSVEAAGLLIEVHRQGGLEDEDGAALAGAVLALVGARLRDLGRVARGSVPVETFQASHNAAIEGADAEDMLLRPKAKSKVRRRK